MVDAREQMKFQERMSNSAHQREVKDLIAAGLNPVLSSKLGGASTPLGAMDYSGGGGGGTNYDDGNGIEGDNPLADTLRTLNPNGNSRFLGFVIPNWMVITAYKTVYGLLGDHVTNDAYAQELTKQSGFDISANAVGSFMKNEDPGTDPKQEYVNTSDWSAKPGTIGYDVNHLDLDKDYPTGYKKPKDNFLTGETNLSKPFVYEDAKRSKWREFHSRYPKIPWYMWFSAHEF